MLAAVVMLLAVASNDPAAQPALCAPGAILHGSIAKEAWIWSYEEQVFYAYVPFSCAFRSEPTIALGQRTPDRYWIIDVVSDGFWIATDSTDVEALGQMKSGGKCNWIAVSSGWRVTKRLGESEE